MLGTGERTTIVKHLNKRLHAGIIALVLFAVMGTWTPAAAQAVNDGPFEKVSFGWKFYRLTQSEAEALNMIFGLYVDASGNINALPGWDWIAEVTYARKSESEESILGDTDITTTVVFFGGGLKKEFGTNPDRIPHCQGLVGFARFGFSASGDFLGDEFDDEFNESAFAIKGSCGFDYRLNDYWDVRFGAGYIRAFTEFSGTNIIRLFVGVVRRL
jgi:hypothetical protein